MRERYNIMADPKKMHTISKYACDLGFSRSFIIDQALDLFIRANCLNSDEYDSKIIGQIDIEDIENEDIREEDNEKT